MANCEERRRKNPKKTFWGYNLRNIYNIYSYSSNFMQNQISHLNWLLLQIGWKYKIKKYFSCKRCAEKNQLFCLLWNGKFSFFRRQSAHTLEFTPRWGTQNIIDKYFQAYAQRKKERLIHQDVNATAAAAENMKLYDWIVFYSGKNSSENGHKIAGAKKMNKTRISLMRTEWLP